MIDITPGNRDVVRAAALPGRADVYFAHPSKLKQRPGWNDARKADPDYPAYVRRLADVMKSEGYHRDKPISVAPDADGSLYVTDGHSRHDAVTLANTEGAGIEAIPFMVEEKGTTEEDRLFGIVSKNVSRPLTPLGEAVVIKQLMARGVALPEIARRIGYSAQVIDARLTLVASPQPIKDMVQAGEVSATLAVATVREHKGKALDVLKAAKADAGGARVTAKAVERVVRPAGGPSDKQRLEWIMKNPVTVQLLSKPGMGRFYAVMFDAPDGVSQKLGEGLTGRDAIDDAMRRDKESK